MPTIIKIHNNRPSWYERVFFFFSYSRRTSAGARRKESDISTVLLHGHEDGHSRSGHVRGSLGGRLHGVRLLEEK